MKWILLVIFTLVNSLNFNTKDAVKVINKERLRYNLPLVSYNQAMHDDLLQFPKFLGPSWFFENSTFPKDIDWVQNPLVFGNKTIFQMHYPKWNGFHVLKYSGLRSFKGNRYMLHDTTNIDIARTLQFRINQRHCFDMSKCSSERFNHYSTCLKEAPPTIGGKKCSWAFAYYPLMLEKSFTSFACVLLDVQGPYSPAIQKKSFWCYFNALKPVDDVPFN